MDFCRNVTVSGGLLSEHEPEQLFSSSCATLGSLDDLFSGNSTMQEDDINLEWLSMFVEDCSSTSGNCLPPLASSILPIDTVQENSSTVPEQPAASKPLMEPLGKTTFSSSTSSSESAILHNKFVVPGKARSKRSRVPICKNSRKSISWSQHVQTESPDPPLLQQAYWLADSELILPKNEEKNIAREVNMIDAEEVMGSFEGVKGQQQQQQQQPRRCSHCLSQKTPQWRTGPLGPKTLCNACGVRYKSGRLLPEYRPAKSPTFLSYKHSNSHKKVLEMRTMSVLSSNGD